MIDWTSVGGSIATVLVALGSIAGGGYAWWMKTQKDRASDRADIAESNTQTVAADAQQTIYKLMLERVTTLEADMRAVRIELTAERAHSRRQDNYIWQLVKLLRDRGIEPPPFDPNGDSGLATEGHML